MTMPLRAPSGHAAPAATPAAASLSASPEPAANVLAIILSTISSMGSDAAADQSFMEAGIDSLGEGRRAAYASARLLAIAHRVF